MTRRTSTSKTGTGHVTQWWPVLLSLLVVLVPTVCVLWFMTKAVENRRQVILRTLADADFTVAQDRLDNYWQQQSAGLQDAWAEGEQAAEVFENCVLLQRADSVVCFDENGNRSYPTSSRAPVFSAENDGVNWADIERLEHELGALAQAAAAYAQAAAAHGDPQKKESFNADLAGRALLGQARCLAKSGQSDQALGILTDQLGRSQYERAVDSSGRLIVGAANLRALQLLEDPTDPRFRTIVERFAKQLNTYRDSPLCASQRRFLMKELQVLVQKRLADHDDLASFLRSPLARVVEFPTLPAEQLAAEFCEANPVPSKDTAVRLTQSPGVWQLASPDKRLFALYKTQSVQSRAQETISARTLKSGALVIPAPPGAEPSSTPEVHSAEAGQYLPGWRLTYAPNAGGDSEPLPDAEITAYFWTGILVIGTMSIFAAIIAQAFRRQMRLTRLRNDLVATVSHELKTPLASMRLLVDTLLDEPRLHEQKVREYLGLVAKENTRLSRLIDNFLAFSRMERNKHALTFTAVRPTDIVDAATAAVGEQFRASGCELGVEVADNLPFIEADVDALVTVLLNLLDNAYKYSGEKKRIQLRAYAAHGNVCFDVQDNGIGLSKVAARKVFKRFYQVDRRVARDTGGVGLGLSIVQFIVTAHAGSVAVRSRPGEGSTFRVTLPSASVQGGIAREN